MKYSIKIFYSEEDEGYIALSEELDNISAFGATEEEALKEIKNAISLYFEEKNIQLKKIMKYCLLCSEVNCKLKYL